MSGSPIPSSGFVSVLMIEVEGIGGKGKCSISQHMPIRARVTDHQGLSADTVVCCVTLGESLPLCG